MVLKLLFNLPRLYLRVPAVVPVVHEQALRLVRWLFLQVFLADHLKVPARRRVRLRHHLDEDLSKRLTDFENHGLQEGRHVHWLRAQVKPHATLREKDVRVLLVNLDSMARDL